MKFGISSTEKTEFKFKKIVSYFTIITIHTPSMW